MDSTPVPLLTELFSNLKDPRIVSNQAAQADRHSNHRHLRRGVWGGYLGGRGVVRQVKAGMVQQDIEVAERHPVA